MTFEEFLWDVIKTVAKHHSLRVGQAIMNKLYECNRSKYESILAGEYDCFYSESIVDKTLEKLKGEWND